MWSNNCSNGCPSRRRNHTLWIMHHCSTKCRHCVNKGIFGASSREKCLTIEALNMIAAINCNIIDNTRTLIYSKAHRVYRVMYVLLTLYTYGTDEHKVFNAKNKWQNWNGIHSHATSTFGSRFRNKIRGVGRSYYRWKFQHINVKCNNDLICAIQNAATESIESEYYII